MNHPELSPDFSSRLERGLEQADRRRRRRDRFNRWRGLGAVALPVFFAACWAVVPWTFGMGTRALIGIVAYLTFALSIAQHGDATFLSYLGLTELPALVDILLLIGVVSWLIHASRAYPRISDLKGPNR